MKEKLVSVFINVYNGEKFIRQSVESVLNQTYKNLQLIVVDDCSTDNTPEILKSITDKRLEVYKNDINRHISYSCNRGISLCKGEYIAHIDADDIWKPDKIEKQIKFLEENKEYGACFSTVDIIDIDDNVVNEKFKKHKKIFELNNMSHSEMIRYLFDNANHLCHSSMLARKSVFEKIGYYDISLLYLQDFDLWLRMLTVSGIYIFNNPLLYYRVSSLSNSAMTENKWIAHDTEYVRIIDNFIKKCPNDLFLEAFSDRLHFSGPHTDNEVLLEKAFLLKTGIFPLKDNPILSINWLSELLKNPEIAKVAEEKFDFLAKNIYELEYTQSYYNLSSEQNKINPIKTENDGLKSTIEGLNMDILNLNNANHDLNKIIQDLNQIIQGLNQAICDKERHITNIENINSDLSGQLKYANDLYFEIKNSFYWRLTAPMRKVTGKLKALFKKI